MKNSQSSILNNTEKNYNNFLKTGFSVLNKNTSTPKKLNNNISSIKFPKILLKTRNRILYIRGQKSKTQYIIDSNCSENIQQKSFQNSFNILNFVKKNKTNKIFPKLRYNQSNIKGNEVPSQTKNLSLLYNHCQNIKNRPNNNNYNYYDSKFIVKMKMTDYRKSLSCDYEKDNRNVIDLMTKKFKQKNDSILNVISKTDGFYIKGLQYKKYYFFPHKKMNILAFHQNIISKNINKMKQRKIIENFQEKKNEEKKLPNIKEINSNKNFLEANIFSRSRKRHWTKNYEIRKKMNQKIEEIVDEEINNILHSQKNIKVMI